MDVSQLWEDLIRPGGGRIVYVVVDGVGGLPDAEKGGTELQVARTPNLDRLARNRHAACWKPWVRASLRAADPDTCRFLATTR